MISTNRTGVSIPPGLKTLCYSLSLLIFPLAQTLAAADDVVELNAYQSRTIPFSAEWPGSIALLPNSAFLAVVARKEGMVVLDLKHDDRPVTSILSGGCLSCSGVSARQLLPLLSKIQGRPSLAGARENPHLEQFLSRFLGRPPSERGDLLDLSIPAGLVFTRKGVQADQVLLVESIKAHPVATEIPVRGRHVRSAKISPDASLLFTSLSSLGYNPPYGDYEVEAQLRDFPSGEVLVDLGRFGNPLSDAEFSRNGRFLLVATGATFDFTQIGGDIVEGPDHRVLIYTIPDAKRVFQWDDFENPVRFAVFGPNERFILAGADHRVSILDWKANQERVRLVVPREEKEFISADMTPDGKTVYTLQKGGPIREWTLEDRLK